MSVVSRVLDSHEAESSSSFQGQRIRTQIGYQTNPMEPSNERKNKPHFALHLRFFGSFSFFLPNTSVGRRNLTFFSCPTSLFRTTDKPSEQEVSRTLEVRRLTSVARRCRRKFIKQRAVPVMGLLAQNVFEY